MDGTIRAGDVVVSRINGTYDFYLIATVVSAVKDLLLYNVLTAKGLDAAITRGFAERTGDRHVWLFDGSAPGYVKARMP